MHSSARSWVTLAVIVAAGCADDPAGTTGDCRDADHACFAPFACTANTTGTYTCTTDALAAPSCSGSPATLEATLSTTGAPGDRTLHWVLSSACIPVTYDAALAGRAAVIGEAVTAFATVPCSRLCFLAPAQSDVTLALDRRERRVHFRALPDADIGAAGAGLAQAYFEATTGRVFALDAQVKQSAAATLTARQALGLLALGAGISAETTAPSVVHDGMGTTAELTTADRAALCHLYGTPSACNDDVP